MDLDTLMQYMDCDGFKVGYRPETADEQVIRETFTLKIFSEQSTGYKPRDDDVVIDVGAHIGTYSMDLAKKIPNGTVYAVEASSASFDLLQKNIQNNEITNISAKHIALGKEDGMTRLYLDKEAETWGHTTSKKISNNYEDVNALTLGTFLRENKIDRCAFVKLNCEGAEFDIVLNADRQTLQKIDRMLILYHEDLVEDHHHSEIIDHLIDAGFLVRVRNKSEIRGWILAERKDRQVSPINVLYVIRDISLATKNEIERYCLQLCRSVKEKNIRPIILTPIYDANIESFEVKRMPMGGLDVYLISIPENEDVSITNKKIEKQFAKLLGYLNIDIVHFMHLFNWPFSLVEICRNLEIRTVYSAFDLWLLCPLIHKVTSTGGRGENCRSKYDPAACSACILQAGFNAPEQWINRLASTRISAMRSILGSIDMYLTENEVIGDELCEFGDVEKEKIVLFEHSLTKSVNKIFEKKRIAAILNGHDTDGELIKALSKYFENAHYAIDIYGTVRDPEMTVIKGLNEHAGYYGDIFEISETYIPNAYDIVLTALPEFIFTTAFQTITRYKIPVLMPKNEFNVSHFGKNSNVFLFSDEGTIEIGSILDQAVNYLKTSTTDPKNELDGEGIKKDIDLLKNTYLDLLQKRSSAIS